MADSAFASNLFLPVAGSIVNGIDCSLISCVDTSRFPEYQLVVVLFFFLLFVPRNFVVVPIAVTKERSQRIVDGTVIAEALLLGGLASPGGTPQRHALDIVFCADDVAAKPANLSLCHENVVNRTLFPYCPLLAEAF